MQRCFRQQTYAIYGTAIEIATFCYANEEIEEEYEEDIISEFDYDYEIENAIRVLEARG